MKMMLFAMAVLGLVASEAPASPLMPSSTAIQAFGNDGIVLVKKKRTARPHGWSEGRKVGWRGRNLPPGQAKKRYRR